MADGVIFRTVDNTRWGAAGGSGTGGNLTPTQFDLNMWEFLTRIQALENDPPTAVSIQSFTILGSQLQINLTDGSHQGPFDLPIAAFRFQGEWVNSGVYLALDIISAAHFGLFLVNIAHTAPASPELFDPNAIDEDSGSPTFGDKLYTQLFGEDTYIYDIGFFFPGKPGIGIDDDSAIAGHVFVHPVTFPISLTDSEAYLKTGASADMSFDIQKNGAVIGSIEFEAGENVGTFTFAAAVDFAVGDRATVMKPTDGVDTDARELSITIKATRIF